MPWMETMVIGTKTSPIPYQDEYRIQAWPHGSLIVQHSPDIQMWCSFSLDGKKVNRHLFKEMCIRQGLRSLCHSVECGCWK